MLVILSVSMICVIALIGHCASKGLQSSMNGIQRPFAKFRAFLADGMIHKVSFGNSEMRYATPAYMVVVLEDCDPQHKVTLLTIGSTSAFIGSFAYGKIFKAPGNSEMLSLSTQLSKAHFNRRFEFTGRKKFKGDLLL